MRPFVPHKQVVIPGKHLRGPGSTVQQTAVRADEPWTPDLRRATRGSSGVTIGGEEVTGNPLQHSQVVIPTERQREPGSIHQFTRPVRAARWTPDRAAQMCRLSGVTVEFGARADA